MRTIKFRGKNKKGEWLYGDLLHWHGVYEDPWIQTGVEKLFDQVTAKGGSVLPETLGQYAELHDKNGKEVYEGDILQCFNTKGEKVLREVVFMEGAFCQKIIMKSPKPCFNPLRNYDGLIHWEIVGNIHDNPELVKEIEL